MRTTEAERDMLDTLRSWEKDKLTTEFTATYADGVWEMCLTGQPHPLFLEWHPDCSPDAVFVHGGVGTSFVEAFNNLSENNQEPVNPDQWVP